MSGKTVVFFVCISLILIFIPMAWIRIQDKEKASTATLSQISRVTGDLLRRDYSPRNFSEFEVPKEYHFLFDTLLQNPIKRKKEGIGIAIARFELHFKNGSKKEMELCFSGKSPIGFFLDGVPYHRSGPYESTGKESGYIDESIVFCTIIGEVSFEKEEGTQSQILDRFSKLWKVSSGSK